MFDRPSIISALRGHCSKDAHHHRARPKCLWLLHNRLLRHCSLNRSIRSPRASNTQRSCHRERCSSVFPSSPSQTPNPHLQQANRVRGRPHYYSTKKEEYAHIRFSLSADFSSLFTWNTKQIFVYVSATWPSTNTTNEAVIWDTIITSPSADHLQNIGPAAMKKLIKSAKGKSIDPSRYVFPLSPFSGL